VSSATSGKQNNHSIGTCIHYITHMYHFNMSQLLLACCDFGFESRRGIGCLSIVNVVCCRVEVCANGRSLVRRSPTESGVSDCDREASIFRRPWPTRAVVQWEGGTSTSRVRSNAGALILNEVGRYKITQSDKDK